MWNSSNDLARAASCVIGNVSFKVGPLLAQDRNGIVALMSQVRVGPVEVLYAV